MAIHLRASDDERLLVLFYGITKDPETHEYMMVLEYSEDGSHGNYLNNNFITSIAPEVLSEGEYTKAADKLENFPKIKQQLQRQQIIKHTRQRFIPEDFLDFSNLPKPKNDENFEKKLEELTKSFIK
ncbi:hypothetical protein Glove_212g245 [Diversispora epigaea]|uniref:Uncharacterized protein n=1 Tax=Diversispora epigaea TaxID=1348612 RepID=A0A397ILH8_9GLOM|nr:hypothetical protein Glove_212g245 [Diversispora epigaea]